MILLSALLWLALLALNAAVFVASPVLVALALFFTWHNPKNIFPAWLQWLNTPDDPGYDQGMYEPQVAFIAATYGWYAKTWYWLGIRNQCYGLFWWIAPKVTMSQAYRVPGTRYPRTKGPYTPGAWFATTRIGRTTYFEFTAVWGWTAAKCASFRIGWKLQPVIAYGGPVVFLFQFKPWLTKDSTT